MRSIGPSRGPDDAESLLGHEGAIAMSDTPRTAHFRPHGHSRTRPSSDPTPTGLAYDSTKTETSDTPRMWRSRLTVTTGLIHRMTGSSSTRVSHTTMAIFAMLLSYNCPLSC